MTRSGRSAWPLSGSPSTRSSVGRHEILAPVGLIRLEWSDPTEPRLNGVTIGAPISELDRKPRPSRRLEQGSTRTFLGRRRFGVSENLGTPIG